MSVTIVSALPSTSPAPQAGGIESMAGSEGGATILNFADLLLGQKLKGLSTTTDEPLTIEDTETGLAETETGSVDAASILAALGLAVPQPAITDPAAKTASAEPLTATTGVGQASDLTVKFAPANAGTEKSTQPDMLAETETPALPAAPLGNDKPARFAVAAAATETTRQAEPLPAGDTQDKAIVAPTNLATATVHREAPLAVHAHVRDQSWSSEFSQKIVWLAGNDKQSAQLTLNPPQMGPIEISLSVDKGSASAAFVSANPEVRDAIETALPRLREMFASAGIQLGQTNVSSESFRQQSESSARNPALSQARGDNAILAGGSGESPTTRAFLGRAANGLVDLFA